MTLLTTIGAAGGRAWWLCALYSRMSARLAYGATIGPQDARLPKSDKRLSSTRRSACAFGDTDGKLRKGLSAECRGEDRWSAEQRDVANGT